MPKKNRGGEKKKKDEQRQVPLERRTILDSRCTVLAPGPITNSGRADGGWMDRIGITAAGLGHIFGPPNALGPIDCFYSNDSYRKAGFCTMQLELHPPLEAIGDTSTAESLTEYMVSYVRETENEAYRRGEYQTLETVERIIDDPSIIKSPASMIVQTAFEVPITPGPNIPRGLTATTIVSLIHFAQRGNVLFKANNFERHVPPLNHQTILASIAYKTSAAPYHGPDPSFSGLQAMSALLGSGGDIGHARATAARAQASSGGTQKPMSCLACGASETADGHALLTCGKCKVATYCGRDCQAADWKRHKRTECQR